MSWRTFGPYRIHYRDRLTPLDAKGTLPPVQVASVTVEFNPEEIAELLGTRAARNKSRRASYAGGRIVVRAEL